ncbi:MAG: CRISPR-associated endonuclease Cas2 [Polyangiaceae bacterium]|nr:CRISPR-associated endonuclease Cas2 [Polyangiaceae bacterium]
MSADRHVVVVYDIVNDRRRTKARAVILQYLTAIQESAFEGKVSSTEYRSLKERLERVIVAAEDRVTIFHLARASAPPEDLGVSRPEMVRRWFWIA